MQSRRYITCTLFFIASPDEEHLLQVSPSNIPIFCTKHIYISFIHFSHFIWRIYLWSSYAIQEYGLHFKNILPILRMQLRTKQRNLYIIHIKIIVLFTESVI